jgi:hypothetical protein
MTRGHQAGDTSVACRHVLVRGTGTVNVEVPLQQTVSRSVLACGPLWSSQSGFEVFTLAIWLCQRALCLTRGLACLLFTERSCPVISTTALYFVGSVFKSWLTGLAFIVVFQSHFSQLPGQFVL